MPPSIAPKERVSPGYTWILLLTVCAAAAGILYLVMATNEFGWQSEPKATPLPKVAPIEPVTDPK